MSKHTPKYLKPYQEAVDIHGGTFDATLWRSKRGQVARFKTFTKYIDFADTSIVDVGCGIGDFASYLVKSSVDFKAFLGVDAMEAMINTAKELSLEKCTFETMDVLDNMDVFEKTDWCVFSGSLNAMTQQDAMGLIRQAFDDCSLGVAFNFLSNQSWRDPSSEDLYPASRFDTLEMLSFAFTQTPLVSFTQTYLEGHDATIILHKQELSQ